LTIEEQNNSQSIEEPNQSIAVNPAKDISTDSKKVQPEVVDNSSTTPNVNTTDTLQNSSSNLNDTIIPEPVERVCTNTKFMGRGVITRTELPDLLVYGTLAGESGGDVAQYEYVQYILPGSNRIMEDNGNYFINNVSYQLKTYFSRGVNFSNSEIRGQDFHLLGRNFTIGEESNNFGIILVSAEKTISLVENEGVYEGTTIITGTYVTFSRESDGKISAFEISFNRGGLEKPKLYVGEKYLESAFNAIDLSFNSVDEYGYANVTIGENCA
jgi:hypothetical protein